MEKDSSDKSILAKSLSYLQQVGEGAIALIKVLFLVLVCYVALPNIWSKATVVDPIGIPKQIGDLGYSGAGLAAGLAAEMRQMEETAETDGQRKYRQEIKAAEQELDIQVPGLPVTVLSALQMVREAIGLQERRVSGEIVQEGDTLVFLLSGERAEPISLPISSDRRLAVRNLIREGAWQAMSTIDCAALAKWSYRSALAGNRQYSETRRIIDRCLKNPVHDDYATATRLHTIMAMVEAAEGNFDAADKRYEVALEISNRAKGDDPEADFTLDAGDGADHARQPMPILYSQIPIAVFGIVKDPLRASVLLNQGKTLNEARAPDKAVIALSKAAVFDDQSVEIASALGNAYQAQASVQRERGEVNDALKSVGLAQEHFERARKLDPTYADTFFNWASLLADNDQCKEALKHFRKVAELKPLDLETYSNWARTLANMGKYSQALKVIRTALNGVSKQTEPSASLAYAFSNKGAILDLFLRDPGSNVVEAGRKKLREEQIDAYRASIAAMPGYPEAHFHLGRVYADLGRPDQALDEMNSYQRLMGDRKAAPAPDAESVAVKYCPSDHTNLMMTFQFYEVIEPHDSELISSIQDER
jgi:tetratricopeptide (TPR) repeat protein